MTTTSHDSSPYIVPFPFPSTPHSSLRRGRPSGYQLTFAHQVTSGLCTSLPTEARHDRPVRGMGSTGRQQSQGQPHSICWGTHIETICTSAIYVWEGVGLSPAYVCSLVGSSVSESPQGFRLVDLPMVFL